MNENTNKRLTYLRSHSQIKQEKKGNIFKNIFIPKIQRENKDISTATLQSHSKTPTKVQ